MIRVGLALVLSSLALSACGGSAPKAAAETASRLLAAAVYEDDAAFEAEIDRPAVREDIRRQVNALARDEVLEVDGGPSDFALDRMISPIAIRLVDPAGQALATPPSADQLAPMLKPAGEDRVCLRGEGRECLLTFAKEPEGWRLVGMKAMDLRIEVASAGD